MSSIQDMINRMKQNRNLRPSKRAKFKNNNRETIYTESNTEVKPIFKEFSEFQVKKTIDRIRKEAKSKKRLEFIVLTVFFGIIGSFLIYNIITNKDSQLKPKVNSSVYNYNKTPPIIWNGKLSEPLKVPYSAFYYIPTVGNLDYVDLERSYEIAQSNMVVEYTSNILFLDKNCDIINKLLPENGSIKYMTVIPSKEDVEPKKIVYRLAKNEPNVLGKIYNLEKHFFYISDLDGKNLTKITERKVISLEWDNQRKEIMFYFFYNKRMNDSLHGAFNIKTNKFRLTSRQE